MYRLLGYVQGMSDLLAPLMVVMQNEVESFWCFVGLMDKMESNFKMDQAEIKEQLANLKILLEFVDSKFSSYLIEHDSANMYFCFRWILILFKREFTFKDVMKLWEILWTDMPCKNFHLLICISILLMKKDDIIANRYGFNEILKVKSHYFVLYFFKEIFQRNTLNCFCFLFFVVSLIIIKFVNDLSLRIDLDKTLKYAEGLYMQLSTFKNLPSDICEIVGLKSPVAKANAIDLDAIEEKFACNLNLPTPQNATTTEPPKNQLGATKSNSNLNDLANNSNERANNTQMSKSMTNKTDQTRQNFSTYSKEDDTIRMYNAYFN
jgi:TBC1 domain family member 15